MTLLPDSWKRKTPPIYRFPTRVRWLAGLLGTYTVSVALALVAYAEEWTTRLWLIPIGVAGQLLVIIAFSEEKTDDRPTNGR